MDVLSLNSKTTSLHKKNDSERRCPDAWSLISKGIWLYIIYFILVRYVEPIFAKNRSHIRIAYSRILYIGLLYDDNNNNITIAVGQYRRYK